MEPRFFLPGARLEGALRLCPEDEAHITRVLRMRNGERLVVCDGEGREAGCVWQGEYALAGAVRDCPGEPTARAHLYPSLAKGERFEWMLQKAVELGATEITPVLSERCIARMPDESRLTRWRRIVREAACQCGRGVLPPVHDPVSFETAVLSATGTRIFCYEEAVGGGLRRALRSGSAVLVLTGPEGGYTPEEAALAGQNGWHTVSLGARILRCETAPLFVLAAMRYEEL